MNLKLIWNDYLILIAIVSNQVARFITIAISTSISSFTQSSAHIEANPVLAILLNFKYASLVLTLFIYALLVAYYLRLRARNMQSPGHEGYRFVLDAFTMIMFFIFVGDMLNDLAALVGILIH